MSDQPLRVHVTFRKAVSDGNYGSESAEVNLEQDVYSTVEEADTAELLLKEARALVHAELNRSPSYIVRRALEQPKPRVPTVPSGSEDDDEDLPY